MNLEEVMKKVNESYAKNTDTKVVFGEAIEKDGIIVIPVAKVRAKVGEGNTFNIRITNQGQKGKEKQETTEPTEPDEKKIEKLGYGIDTKITPMGFIEIKNGKAEFKPVLDISRLATMGICLAGFSIFLMTRMITKVAKICCHRQCKCKNKGEDQCCCDDKKTD